MDRQERVKVIVKLGGAAITFKDKFETPNDMNISSACSQIADLYQRIGPCFVVCHGAGSFGHHTAKQYGVKGGWTAVEGACGATTAQRVRLGFALTRNSVKKLNWMIVQQLTELGVPAVSVSPFDSGWACKDGKVSRPEIGVSSMLSALEARLIPVLHGDCVLDSVRGCTILSADVLMSEIAVKTHSALAVFLTDVDGIFNRNPSEPGARLIERIEVDQEGGWRIPGEEAATKIEVSSSGYREDVTGGMEAKLNEALTMVRGGTRVLISCLGGEGGQEALVNFVRVEGKCTEIVLSSS